MVEPKSSAGKKRRAGPPKEKLKKNWMSTYIVEPNMNRGINQIALSRIAETFGRKSIKHPLGFLLRRILGSIMLWKILPLYYHNNLKHPIDVEKLAGIANPLAVLAPKHVHHKQK